MKKLVVVVILASIFSSCLKNQIEEIPQEDKDDRFIIDVPKSFNWSSIEGISIEVTMKHNGAITYALDSTVLELYDEDDYLLDALTIYDGKAEFNVRIPSSVAVLKLKSPAANITKEFIEDSKTVDLDIPDLSVISFAKVDNDKDGLYDAFDDFPNNPERTISINSFDNSDLKSAQGKAIERSSYVIFEDLWPSKGDYDFNDLVAKTTFSWERGNRNYIEEIEGNCEVEWIGAGMSLGLGFELFEANGTNITYLDDVIKEIDGAIKDNSVENGIILFNVVQNVGMNSVKFKISLKDKAFKDCVFVPYLFRTDNKGHQVRPFGAPPTESQTMSLFHSSNDVSPAKWEWNKGKKFKYPLDADEAFYKTAENHPWGIEFITKTKFKPSSEGTTIIKSFPKFRSWAESGITC